ncbi:MAG: mechanosensitive ion channel family protein [Spirochaetaceae bacterium]|nr:mechanosensitive ion channel family protein [Spirochaetaceae bacterium]
MLESIKAFFTAEMVTDIISAAIGLVVFFLLYLLIKKIAKKILTKKEKPQVIPTVVRIIRYIIYVLLVIYILGVFNIDVSALLGAAGIVGVAVSFASQTSLSNIISGFFIVSEHALKIGDFITVEGISGTVDAIDLLSVKIKTPDNQMVRIPNEKILNTNLQNTSFYPTRRINVTIPLNRRTDLEYALAIAKEVPVKCPNVLSEPEPIIYYDGFNEAGINLVIAVWLNNSDLFVVKNQVYTAVKRSFEEANIEIAYPRLELHTKS